MSEAIAVVIPTLERPDAVLEVVAALRSALAPGDEVLVVEQSAPPARERVRAGLAALADPRVRMLERAPGLPAARNAGVAATTAPIVWFLDDDVRVAPGALEAHRAAYVDPTVGGVGGRTDERRLRPNTRGPACRVGPGGRIRTHLEVDAPGELETLKGANMSFRRAALRQAGPFDEGFGGTALLEDADLSTRVRRAGWRLRYVPEARVEHLHLPAGGVRTGSDPRAAERWRFRNTGRFVGRHRGLSAAPRVLPTFAAIALARAWRWRSPRAAPRLLGALVAGFVEGRRSVVAAPIG